ncbi:MAG: hypothetical protein ABI142_08615 [Bryocella sp.]
MAVVGSSDATQWRTCESKKAGFPRPFDSSTAALTKHRKHTPKREQDSRKSQVKAGQVEGEKKGEKAGKIDGKIKGCVLVAYKSLLFIRNSVF